jgi:hypothetical protein
MAEQVNNGVKFLWWVLGIIGTLLVAGVIGSIGTYAAVRSLDTNLTLFRGEVRREFTRQEADISGLETKIDRHIYDTTGRVP